MCVVVETSVADDVGSGTRGTRVAPACDVAVGCCPCGMPNPPSSILDNGVVLLQVASHFVGGSKRRGREFGMLVGAFVGPFVGV